MSVRYKIVRKNRLDPSSNPAPDQAGAWRRSQHRKTMPSPSTMRSSRRRSNNINYKETRTNAKERCSLDNKIFATIGGREIAVTVVGGGGGYGSIASTSTNDNNYANCHNNDADAIMPRPSSAFRASGHPYIGRRIRYALPPNTMILGTITGYRPLTGKEGHHHSESRGRNGNDNSRDDHQHSSFLFRIEFDDNPHNHVSMDLEGREIEEKCSWLPLLKDNGGEDAVQQENAGKEVEEDITVPATDNLDVMLGMNNKYYKESMWHQFRKLGETRDSEKECQAGNELLSLFKEKKGRNGIFLRMGGARGRVAVDDEMALGKIMADIRRRLESRDKWYTNQVSSDNDKCLKPGDDGDALEEVALELDQNDEKHRNTDPIDIENALAEKKDTTDGPNGASLESSIDGNEKSSSPHKECLSEHDNDNTQDTKDTEDTSRNDAILSLGGESKQSEIGNGDKDGSLNEGNDKNDSSVAPASVVEIGEKDSENHAVMESEALVENGTSGDSNRDYEESKELSSTEEVKESNESNSSNVVTSDQSKQHVQHKQQEQLLVVPQCPPASFNKALKAALDSYHESHTLVKSRNDPPISPTLPPPFLSHAEECTLKMALAFVMAKARVMNKNNNEKRASGAVNDYNSSRMGRKTQMGLSSLNSIGGGSMSGHHADSSKPLVGGRGIRANSRLHYSLLKPRSEETCGKSSLRGGLLPMLPSRRVVALSTGNSTNGSNSSSISFDRKTKHVRDVLKLAVSAVMPLYRGALEEKECCDPNSDDNGRFFSGEGKPRVSKSDNVNSVDDDATMLEEGEGGDSHEEKSGNDSPSNKNRRPCAVYDYEAAVQPLIMTDENGPSSSYQRNGSDNNRATLDGLCQHAIVRLSALIREAELRARNSRLRAIPKESKTGDLGEAVGGNDDDENDENHSSVNGSPTVVTNRSRETANNGALPGRQRTTRQRQRKNSTIYNAILNLISNDLIGDACLHGPRSSTYQAQGCMNSSDVRREYVEGRIEKIMAVCHVLHRLLFLDKACHLGTECVNAICCTLSDLYSDQYCIRRRFVTGEQDGDCNSFEHRNDERDGGSLVKSTEKYCGLSSRTNNGHHQNHNDNPQNNKEKYQVVPSRWSDSSSLSTGYIHDRHRRRCQSVDGILSQQKWVHRRSMNNDHAPHFGAKKRIHSQDESAVIDGRSMAMNTLPLPRISDVLAVNLLRLLEGAAAIRLHHRQQQQRSMLPSYSSSRYSLASSSYNDRDGEYTLDKVASLAATEVLTEIRQMTTESEMILPLQVEDAATFYYNEKIRSGRTSGNSSAGVLLGPGGKMMLRLHLFDLTRKLASY